LPPAIPAKLDQNPTPLGPLPNGQMGTLALEDDRLVGMYGALALRYNTLRQYVRCVFTEWGQPGAGELCTPD